MTALDALIDRYRDAEARGEYAHDADAVAAARHEQAKLLALIQTLALALAREYQVPLDECSGGVLGKAREVLGRYETTNR
jgi:hypothetical protein